MAKPEQFPSHVTLAAADRAAEKNRRDNIDSYLICGDCKRLGIEKPFHFGVLKIIQNGAVNVNDVQWHGQHATCPKCKSPRNPIRSLYAPEAE